MNFIKDTIIFGFRGIVMMIFLWIIWTHIGFTIASIESIKNWSNITSFEKKFAILYLFGVNGLIALSVAYFCDII